MGAWGGGRPGPGQGRQERGAPPGTSIFRGRQSEAGKTGAHSGGLKALESEAGKSGVTGAKPAKPSF